MINKPNSDLLENNMTTLEKISLEHNPKKTIDGNITNSKLEVIHFDKVKERYQRIHGINNTPESNDALYWDETGRIIFIEFKNSPLRNIKSYEIRKKIYDSVLIFSDIVGVGISQMRECVEYIIVYNNSSTHERDKIAKAVNEKGNKKFLHLRLHEFKGFCFKDVDTYSKTDFEKFLHTLSPGNNPPE